MGKCTCIDFHLAVDGQLSEDSKRMVLDMPLDSFLEIQDEFRRDLASIMRCAVDELPSYTLTEISHEESEELEFAPYTEEDDNV